MSKMTGLTKSPYFKKTIIALFIMISIAGWLYFWIEGRYYASTEDAYINANVVQIAPRISGEVSALDVVNNQHVAKDSPLFSIDKAPYQVAFDKASAQMELSQTEYNRADASAKRTLTLVGKKYSSAQSGDDAKAALQSAESQLKLAKANLQQAQLNLNWTDVKAPTSGWVTNVSLRVGDIINANQPVFALISDEEFWVDANFKETELASIQIGQRADISIDMYPDRTFHGVVESISGGTGSAFSLLPPQNATGNWVKVTQRVPVRIRVLNPDNNKPLIIGTSVNVTINLDDFVEVSAR